MKKYLIYILLLALLGIVLVFVLGDLRSTRIENRPSKSRELIPDSLKDADAYPVSYKETRQLKLSTASHLQSIDVAEGLLYVAHDNVLKIMNLNGSLLSSFETEGEVQSIATGPDKSVFILHRNFFVQMDSTGNPLFVSDHENDSSVFTSVAYHANDIFVADAGNRRVLRYDFSGEKTGSFQGVYKSSNASKGFIIPSPYFDLAVNEMGELWVVNPGTHTLQHYSRDGDLINFWEKAGNNIEGFTGCCNPAQMAILQDGRFVTAEKGLVRIKVYSVNGELEEVVALPVQFKGKKAPDLALSDGRVFALDYDQKMIRVFEKISNE